MILHLNVMKHYRKITLNNETRKKNIYIYIYEYDKNVDKKSNTKIKFVDHLDRQTNKVVVVLELTLNYIERNEEHNKVEYKLYSKIYVEYRK